MNSKTYSTTDLWIAAFLKAKGLKLQAVHRESGTKRVIFVFQDGPERLQLTKDFFDNATIGIVDIRNAMAETKSAVFNMPD